jgi:hypothetical protein
MNTTISPLRRVGATVAIAGIAALGSVAVAPAASAATQVVDGENYVIEGNGNGPDAFVVTATGRIPVFFCEDGKPGKEAKKAAKKAAEEAEKAAKELEKGLDKLMKQHNICQVISPTGDRF